MTPTLKMNELFSSAGLASQVLSSVFEILGATHISYFMRQCLYRKVCIFNQTQINDGYLNARHFCLTSQVNHEESLHKILRLEVCSWSITFASIVEAIVGHWLFSVLMQLSQFHYDPQRTDSSNYFHDLHNIGILYFKLICPNSFKFAEVVIEQFSSIFLEIMCSRLTVSPENVV